MTRLAEQDAGGRCGQSLAKYRIRSNSFSGRLFEQRLWIGFSNTSNSLAIFMLNAQPREAECGACLKIPRTVSAVRLRPATLQIPAICKLQRRYSNTSHFKHHDNMSHRSQHAHTHSHSHTHNRQILASAHELPTQAIS